MEEVCKCIIRLDFQEEKIYYDLVDDDDNLIMSVMSYLGQEWNLYGEFDYFDFGDELYFELVRGW